jgi:hypothetical protein
MKKLIKKEKVKMEVIDLISDIVLGKKDINNILTFLIKK